MGNIHIAVLELTEGPVVVTVQNPPEDLKMVMEGKAHLIDPAIAHGLFQGDLPLSGANP